MVVIIWEYQVKAERAAEFERIYSSDGAWAELFRKAEGYLSTELLRDPNRPHRYLTMDRWASPQDYDSFLLRFKTEYARLDVRSEHLTETEAFLGRWEAMLPETR